MFLLLGIRCGKLQGKKKAPLAIWEDFSKAFIDHFFALELRESRVDESLNLNQHDLSVREYSLRFTQLSRFDPELVNTKIIDL